MWAYQWTQVLAWEELIVQSRSPPTMSAYKLSMERVVWYLWATSLALVISTDSGHFVSGSGEMGTRLLIVVAGELLRTSGP